MATNLGLLLLGALFVELTRTGVHEFSHFTHGLSETIFCQLAIWLGGLSVIERGRSNRLTLWIILAVALSARMLAVAAPPFLSTDVYRYVWDGEVQHAHINPYRHIPADPQLAGLRDAQVYPRINRRDYAHTIYPPGAQMVFYAVTSVRSSVVAMKAAMVLCEAITCWALLLCLGAIGAARERILLYAWQPVCVYEIGSSGHVDAGALTAIALALLWMLRGRWKGAIAWLAGATLIKLYPAALLPALLPQRLRAAAWGVALFAGLVVLGYAPYLTVGKGVLGFLPAYAQEEGLESGTRYFPLQLFERITHLFIRPEFYLVLCAAGLAVLAWLCWRRAGRTAEEGIRSGLVLATALTLCFSPHYPWYFLWLLPFVVLWPWRPAIYLVLAATYLLSTQLGLPGEPMFRMNSWLYGGFCFFLLIADPLERRAAVAFASRLSGSPEPPHMLDAHTTMLTIAREHE